ncbi:MAG: hypothetical protein RLZ10_416 [Bacteroidota bacterium]|jgi:hypothetical protein
MKENRFKPKPKTIFIELVLVTSIFISAVIFITRFCWANIIRFQFEQLSCQCTSALIFALILFAALTSFFIKIISRK